MNGDSMTKADDQYSEQETKRRRDAVIKLMLATPPKPHSEMKVGKPREKSMTPKRPTTQRKAKKPTR
jgi:tRNA pseudouridine-54 N-methylase